MLHLAQADVSFVGEGEDERAGEDTEIVGDLNGDGLADILVGANLTDQEADDAGSVYLIFGSTSGWNLDTSLADADAIWTGIAEDDYTGRAFEGAGDVNGDGYDDVIIGVASSDANGSDSGQAHLWFGNPCGWFSPTSLSHSAAQFIGEAAGDYTGIRVTGGGDLNGDGRDDLGFGAAHNEQAAPNSGKAFIVLDLCKDHDGDGYDPCNGDCDDNDPDIHPDAHEDLQDGLDNDCDGLIDGDEPCGDDDDDDGDDDDDDSSEAGDDDDTIGGDDDDVAEAPEGEDGDIGESYECRSAGQAHPVRALLLTCLGIAVFVRIRRTFTSRTAA